MQVGKRVELLREAFPNAHRAGFLWDSASQEQVVAANYRRVVCSRTRGAALPTDRPICNARVPQAIGQSFDWLVSAEAEVLGARVADRPATSHLAELE